MKEFSTTLKDELTVGLRQDERAPIYRAAITTLQNLKPKEYGIVGNGTVENFIDDVSISFPFPQLFRGMSVTLLATADALYYVDESNWSVSLITTYDATSRDATRSIVAGGIWHFTDMGRAWILTNGSCVVFRSGYDLIDADYEDRVYVATNCIPNSMCYYKGRIVSLGFPDIEDHAVYGTLSENMMTFSAVGGKDVFWNYLTDKVPAILSGDYLESNDFGFAPVGRGCGLVCKELGEHVLFYTEDCVFAGTHHINPANTPAISTIGLRRLIDVGVASRGSVGGDNKQHVFIDRSGTLWSIGADLSVQRLGYKEIFSSFDTCDDAIISIDIAEREFYICNSTEGYILTQQGLGQLGKVYSTILNTHEGLTGFGTDLSLEQTFTFGPIDFGIRAGKMIESIEIGGVGLTSMYARALSSFDNGSTYYTGDWVPFNSRGFAVLHKSGVMFKIEVKGVWGDNAHLAYMTMRWKIQDKANIRGMYNADTSAS